MRSLICVLFAFALGGVAGALLPAIIAGWPAQGMPTPTISQRHVTDAQKASTWGENPAWLDRTGEERAFQTVRDRSYEFCATKEPKTQKACSEEQDQAIQSAILALMLRRDQAAMPNKASLDSGERWLADHPEVVKQVKDYCWTLYNEYGSRDARLLAICLGNLPGGSPIWKLPVP